MSETTSSPHEKLVKPKNVGAAPAAKPPSAKDTAQRLQEERTAEIESKKEEGGLLERRLSVSQDVGELYYLRCPSCSGEGAYFRKFPGGRVMGSDDWFTTYKDEHEPWTWTVIPCQECWEKGVLTPLRVEGWMPNMEIGREAKPMFLLNGKWTRFICTRSHLSKLRRIADAERTAISARLAAIEEAKREAARAQ